MADGKKKSSTTRKPARPVKRAAAPKTPAPAAVTAHLEFELDDQSVERALQTGEYSNLLEDYFGSENYAELRQLKREAESRSVRGGPVVLILPGIMGSKIGTRRALPPFDDVYWFDPVDVAMGRLSQLALPSSKKLEPLGVILLAYLKLKLQLQIAGYDAKFHPFDWRLSLPDLGKELAVRMQKEGNEVSLVAHSMGGLVARAAIAKGAKFRRLVMLGTPNYGSFAPVMAFRGTYPVVLKIAELDRENDAQQLAGDIFTTFPGLTQMLPSPERFSTVDLYDLSMWPPGTDKLRPRKEILSKVKDVQKGLAAATDSFFLIAGFNHDTVVGLQRKDDGRFDYEISRAGDGTVPLELARISGAKTYYIEESHGSLPNNKRVAKAVIDILGRGATTSLPETAPAPVRATRLVPEETLRVPPYGTRRDGALSQRELRHVLDEVASPSAREDLLPATAAGRPIVAIPGNLPAVEAGYQHRFERVVVGRRRQHRIDLRFALGSITEADTRAIVLGIFRDVKPGGAAAAIDERLEGAITEMSHRRMFSGEVGEIFILPTGRYALTADLITFVGLGPFDRFNDEVLQTAAENVIRTFVRTRVEEFSTVLFGGSSGEAPASALRNLLIGFFRGLCDADRDHQFRRIVVCENNPERYVAIKEELYRLSSTSLCQDVEITFDEEVLRQPPILEPTRRGLLIPRRDPTYLIVRAEQQGEIDGEGGAQRPFDVRSAVLTAGGKATVVTGLVEGVTLQEIDARIDELAGLRDMDLSEVGGKLAKNVLAPEVLTVLSRQRDRHLVLVHDGLLSRVPWETIALQADGQELLPAATDEITFPAGPKVWFPAAEKGLSRRYAADNLSVAKWLQERLQDEVLRILLVVDPTGDLPGAAKEGTDLRNLLAQLSGVRVEELRKDQATRPAVLSAFSSGRYDVIHYAGHAFFDRINPERSGLLCHGKVPLTGADLAGLANLPTLVFFNACESARVRGEAATDGTPPLKEQRQTLRDTTGFAEAFLRGGIANFLGTYWPVGDAAAETFAGKFYQEILQGQALGDALQTGREEVRKVTSSKDWADYIFYGNPDFILKEAIAADRQARQA